MSAGSSIIICGQRFDVGQRVITYEDDQSISAYTLHRTDDPSKIYPFSPAKGLGQMAARYRQRRLMGTDRSLDRLRQVITQFVVHHDGCFDSRQCFGVLHNERGLSVHFLIDWDGTIFQTLDLVDCAFQAAGVNEISVGVELANRGDALRFPDVYNASSGIHSHRDKVTCTINNSQFLAYTYTKAQVDSMISIGKCLARVFPSLPQTCPSEGGGEPIWNSLQDPREYKGYLGHYHVTNQKWDPGPFDFKSFTTNIRSRMFFPVVLGSGKPEIPDDPQEVESLAEDLFSNNETEGEGGYFPVGPFEDSKLWHSGVHLRVDKGTPVYAPFAGKVVAARMNDYNDSDIGSVNFVLLRHNVVIGPSQVTFWTLYFHVDMEEAGKDAAPWPPWFQKVGSQLGSDASPLSVDVAAGELIAHAGEAGPPGRLAGQVHIEVMSTEELGEKIQPGFWHVIEAADEGHFCTAPDIVNPIDKTGPKGKRDGLISRAELLQFFHADPARKDFHKFAIHHVSEWAQNDDWRVVINRAPDYAAMPKAQRDRLYVTQIEPTLWWSDDIGEAAGLPSDKIIWSYHPITFVFWAHDQQQRARSNAKGISNAASFGGKPPPSFLKDDADATEGFTDDEDELAGEAAKRLDLPDLAKGYPDEKEK